MNASSFEGVLAQFDPSLLANGTYTLRVIAEDTGGNIGSSYLEVDVTGDLKVGNFALSFTDLSIPVSGVPITVTRTYDSLIAAQDGQLGLGWRLELADTKLSDEHAADGPGRPRASTTRSTTAPACTSRCPAGRRGLHFPPHAAARPGRLGAGHLRRHVRARFRRVQHLACSRSRSAPPSSAKPSTTPPACRTTPPPSAFGGTYILTTQDGLAYEIDGDTGKLQIVADADHNSLTFTDDGIV